VTTTRRAVATVGELLVTLGVIVLLFAAYELWGTGVYTDGQQATLQQTLQHEWQTPAPAASSDDPTIASTPGATPTSAAPTVDLSKVPAGSPLAILRIPRLGSGYDKVIVQGVGVEDLKRGPGHMPGTAFPGQTGNFVVSGHRTTYGAPFNRLDELRPGDPVVIQTKDTWFVYRVTSSEVVKPTETSVVAPVPHHPGQPATEAIMTMTTCNPKYSAAQRLIVYAALDSTTPVSAGPPAVVAKG
jgi:sortase A